MQPLIVLDTETTGFPRDAWSRVVELAAVLLDAQGQEVDTWSDLILPDLLDARAEPALTINHLSIPQLQAEGRPTAEAALSFHAWYQRHGSPLVTAFNVDFDRPMVERMGLHLRWADCLMLRSMAVMGPAGALRPANRFHRGYDPARPWLWPKLTDAAAFFRVPPTGPAHRALADARTAAGIAAALSV